LVHGAVLQKTARSTRDQDLFYILHIDLFYILYMSCLTKMCAVTIQYETPSSTRLWSQNLNGDKKNEGLRNRISGNEYRMSKKKTPSNGRPFGETVLSET
jgi:hypothetical protein